MIFIRMTVCDMLFFLVEILHSWWYVVVTYLRLTEVDSSSRDVTVVSTT